MVLQPVAFGPSDPRVQNSGGKLPQSVPIEFPALDGYPLRGSLYARDPESAPKTVVVFNAGAGLPISVYRNFRAFLSGTDSSVVAYDYRGVGGSAPRSFRGFDAGFEDWAEFDQAGAVAFAHMRYPQAQVATVSHSIGCMIAAMAPNAGRAEQMVFIAPHIGYWRDYRWPWRIPMTMFWHVLMPLLAQSVGHFPGKWFGTGVSLPRRFALQWARQTKTGELNRTLMSGETRERLLENAKKLRLPALVLTFEDDAFVSDTACARFVQVLPRIRPIRKHLDCTPEQIGHWDFFRRRNRQHWAVVRSFLETPLRLG